MITQVQDVYYNVQNMQRAVRFYTEALGMKLLDTSEWWTSLECGGLRIGLHGTGGAPVPAVPRDAHGAHAGGTLTLRSDDLATDTARLREAGARILGQLAEPWGRLTVFEDPEGNVLKLMAPA